MDVVQVALKGKTAWCAGRMRRRFMKAKTGAVSGGVLEAGLEDIKMRTRRVVLVRLEWHGIREGGSCRSAPVDASWSDTITNVSSSASSSLLVSTFISRHGTGTGA